MRGMLLGALFVIAILALLQGIWVALSGTTVMQQVLCALYFLIFTVALIGISLERASAPGEASAPKNVYSASLAAAKQRREEVQKDGPRANG